MAPRAREPSPLPTTTSTHAHAHAHAQLSRSARPCWEYNVSDAHPPEDDDGREEFLARIAALPPLTEEQLDSLADLLAWIELGDPA